MRILYGVVGEGMGHALRSRVVLDELTREHQVQVVVSGRAHDY
ncbi:MAG TPA: glycosyltransferase family protein, partial [Anaeromyxobacteraceae bacterium]|nr:glycosyltransferase family protein [Anaeromyxobacteraceae bacterium]